MDKLWQPLVLHQDEIEQSIVDTESRLLSGVK